MVTRQRSERTATCFAAAMALGMLVGVGCVERTITINTDPQGALVYLNDEEVGRTPVTKNFTWYGDYDVIIRKEGYQTLKTHTKLIEPWYQIPGIDFFAECLTPVTMRDNRHFEYTLEPAEKPSPNEIIERAQEFKERTLYGEK
jgi:hypothetical protein